jgi:GntR family transcriptional regulator
MAADHSSPLPLYFKVMMELQEKILSGEWSCGAQIPGEVELTKTLGVSVITVRQAMAQLVRDRYIERHRAKGSFVNRDVPQRQKIAIDVEVDDLIHVSADTKFKLLSSELSEAPRAVAEKLAIAASDIKRIVRVRMQADHPLEYIVTYIAAPVGRKIPDKAFSHMALPLVLGSYTAVEISEVKHTIGALLADAEVARSIEIPLGSPVLMIERDYLEHEKIVAVSAGYYRSDLFRYELKLTHRPTQPRKRQGQKRAKRRPVTG